MQKLDNHFYRNAQTTSMFYLFLMLKTKLNKQHPTKKNLKSFLFFDLKLLEIDVAKHSSYLH